MPRETAGEVIRGHRKANAMSLRELAVASGVSHSTVYRLESGQDCLLSAVIRLADALRLDDAQRLRIMNAQPGGKA